VTLEGRDAELGVIASVTGRLHLGGQAIVLVGEPGAGKTALLEAATARARSAGVLVLPASGVEFEADIPYSGLSQAALPLVDTLDGLGPPHRQVLRTALGLGHGPAPTIAAVAGATLALLTAASRTQPVLVTVDDLQWLDRMSAAALSFVARRVTSLEVGFLGAVRTGAATFFDRSGCTEMELGPLDQTAAERLLRGRFPALTGAQVARLVAQACGNPLALVELPMSLRAGPDFADAPVLPSSTSVSGRVRDMFASRVEGLPPASRQLLLLTAFSGRGELPLLRAAAGDTVLADLAPAERVNLVSVDDRARRVRFRHPLAGAAVVAMSTAQERFEAHRALAAAVDGDVVRRALHLAEASLAPDEDVAAALDQAGRHFLHRGDGNGAAQALIRAAEASPSRQDRERRLAEAAYIGADVTGDLEGALALLARARAGSLEVPRSMAAVLATSYVLLNADCDIDAAHVLLAGALEAAGADLDATDDVLVDLLHSLLMVCWTGGRADLWSALHTAVDRLRPTAPELLEICAGAFGDATHATAPVLPQLSRTIATLRYEQDPVRITRVGLASVYVDRIGDCRPALWRVVDDGRSGGAVALAINALTSLSVDDWQHGRWDDVQAQAAEGLRLSERHGYHRYSWILGSYLSTLVATARGELDRGRIAADELSDWARAKGAGIADVFAAHLRCLAALSAGDFEEGFEQACAITPAGVLAPHVPHALWVALDLVEAGVRSGHHDEARAHVDVLRENGIATLSSRLALVVGSATAMVASERDYRDLFEEALAGEEVDQWCFDHARARLLFGERLRRSRAVKLSRMHLSAAAESFAALGATPWRERAEKELRATGQHHTGRAPTSPDMLTAQEWRIAMLAAEGLTNKQIGRRLYLSPRTVGAHLYSLFPRLGITSRAALRDALIAIGDAPEPAS
jgi:DNA-binding NarL/FixJ family response regulator